MIRRLSVKNYRSLVDFTWEPGPETLVLGANGSGKSAAIDALNVVRDFACGWSSLQDLFDPDEPTAWVQGELISFELDLEAAGSTYRYEVGFEWSRRDGTLSVWSESLFRGGDPIFERDRETVSVHDRDVLQDSAFPFPRSQSALVAMSAGPTAAMIRDLEAAMLRMVAVRPMPPLMERETRKPTRRPDWELNNFVAWYWALAEDNRIDQPLSEMLRGVWSEFDSLALEKVGREAMALAVRFGSTGSSKQRVQLDFEQLSDGERMLIALYTLAAYQQVTEPTTIIVDEPDNFVSLAELQPWLLKMLDDRPDGGQIILVSHNPEIIDTMGESRVDYFERTDHMSTTRVRKIEPDDTGLSLSERIARGWVGE